MGPGAARRAGRAGRQLAAGPDAFEQANETAIEQFRGYLAAKLREIMVVEYVFGNNPATYDGEGPRGGMPVAQRLSDIQRVGARRGHLRAGRAGTGWPGDGGHADHGGNRGHRAEAIRWAVDRVREQPAYQRLRELRGDAGVMDRDVLDTIERDINEEVRARFPGTRCGRLCCCNTATTRRSGRGTCGSGCCSTRTAAGLRADLMAFRLANYTAIEQFAGYLAEKLRRSGWSSTRSATTVTRDGHGPRLSISSGTG